jgi:hypothetical protein
VNRGEREASVGMGMAGQNTGWRGIAGTEMICRVRDSGRIGLSSLIDVPRRG